MHIACIDALPHDFDLYPSHPSSPQFLDTPSVHRSPYGHPTPAEDSYHDPDAIGNLFKEPQRNRATEPARNVDLNNLRLRPIFAYCGPGFLSSGSLSGVDAAHSYRSTRISRFSLYLHLQ